MNTLHVGGARISKVENKARLFKEVIQFNPEKLQVGGVSLGYVYKKMLLIYVIGDSV